MKFRFQFAVLILALLVSSMTNLTANAQRYAPIIDEAYVGCNYASFIGRTVSREATSIKVTVNLASDLTNTIASEIVPTIGENYSASLTYPAQPANTRLIFAFIEYDSEYNPISRAHLIGYDCEETPPQEYPTTPTATITDLGGTNCNQMQILGTIGTPAPQVMIRVSTLNNLFNLIATEVATVYYDGFYTAFDIPPQQTGTTLIITAGEWDGEDYLAPATIESFTCAN